MDTQVSQLTRLMQGAHAFFQDELRVSFDALVAPIEPALPSGRPVRGSNVYGSIERARHEDDASLPMGGWEYELKRADWDKVTTIAADALRHKSKDLQLAAWLLEAQIHQSGFAGIAPCLMLLQALCDRYWDTLYPEAEGGDLEFRANVFRWINDKLLPALRLVPIAAADREGDYRWTDWEQARRNEQVRANLSSQEAEALEGATSAQLSAAMTATTTEYCVWLHDALTDALVAIELLNDTLDHRFGRDAPSLGKLAGLLGQIHSLVEAELNKRGYRAAAFPQPVMAETDDEPAPSAEEAHGPSHAPAPAAPGAPHILRDRFEAYAQLAEAADFLMRIEPHSPTPYLVQRAVEWGRMNTTELYHELFIRLGGQLNIFDMLGLQTEAGNGEAQ